MASNKSHNSGVTNQTVPYMGSGSTMPPPQNQPQIPVQQTDPNQVVATAQQANSANNANFSDTDTQGFHDLFNGRQYFQRQVIGIDSEIARQNYLVANPEPVQFGGDGIHSPSQNLNWELSNNLPLSATHAAMRDGLDEAMHNLGYNLNLQRYDHDTFVNQLLSQVGIRNANYMNMTQSQLQAALVGHTYSEQRYLSTSYNDFKNAQNPSTFTSRAVRIEYRAKASTQAFMPGDGPGGRLGEIIVARNAPSKIVGVKLSNTNNARAQGTPVGYNNRKQITLIVELG